MKNCKINETHIMVVRKNNYSGKLETEYLPLKFNNQAKLDKLAEYAHKPGVTGVDVYNTAKQKGLGCLLDGYNFCDYVSGSYQSCPPISSRVASEYTKGEGFFNLVKSRTVPYTLSKMYEECRKDKSIVAFSSRYIGWNRMHFDLNDDLSIAYNTNFGYGYANYFTANLKYKDIDILPYSMWVHYYKANLSQILRYTRTYYVDNSEWEPALNFGRDVCNSLVQNPSGFANEWLVGEVKNMVSGLRDIFNNHGSVIAVNLSNGSKRELTSREDIILYKGEKMSGALSFLDKIKEIEKLNVSMESYIEEILDMNRQMVPELKSVIDEYEAQLAGLEEEHADLMETIAPYKSFVDSHVLECATNFIGSSDYSGKREAVSIMERISETFAEQKKELDSLEKIESELSSRIYHLKSVRDTLAGYIKTIEKAMETEMAIAA